MHSSLNQPVQMPKPASPNLQAAREAALEICRKSQSLFDRGDIWSGMNHAFQMLARLRTDLSPEVWAEVCPEVADLGDAAAIIRQDPITRHSFEKPRGYAGDAALLDLIYNDRSPGSPCTDIGRQVWDYTVNAAEAVAVRERKRLLTEWIQRTVERAPRAHILSIACGHLRELLDVHPFPDTCTITGLDQDELSLKELKRSLPSENVIAVKGSVKSVLSGRVDGAGYDFIYAVGLYDYLSTPLARRLTQKMFEMLRSGGELLVANFAEGGSGIGYVQTFMDRRLIYRSRIEVSDFAALVPPDDISESKVFSGENGHVHYLYLSRL